MSLRKTGSKPAQTGPIAKLLHRIVDSLLSKTVGLTASVLTLILWGTAYVFPTNKPVPQPSLSVPSRRPLIATGAAPRFIPNSLHRQTSYDSNSPNISSVRRDVHIKYGVPAELAPLRDDPSVLVHSPFSPTDSTLQISHGFQSPNVSGVDGSVDIQYATAVHSGENSPEKAK